MSAYLKDGHTESVLCVDVQNVGDKIASGGENGELCLWKKDTTLLSKTVREDDCSSVCFSKENLNKLYAAFSCSILVFDLSDLNHATKTWKFNQDEINQLSMDEKEKFLAACDDSGEVKIIDLGEDRVYKTLRMKHTNICSSVVFHRRKPWEMITGGLDSKLIHWDFSRPKCMNIFNMEELQHSVSTDLDAYMVSPPFIHCMAMSPDGNYLACALENGVVAVFCTKRKHLKEIFNLYAHSQGASQVCFLSNRLLVSGGNDCNIIVWDLQNSLEVNPHAVVNGTALNSNGADPTSNGAIASNGVSEPHSQSHDSAQTHVSNPHDVTNEHITGACKVIELHHTGKINWLKSYEHNGQQYLAVADQSPNISLLTMDLV